MPLFRQSAKVTPEQEPLSHLSEWDEATQQAAVAQLQALQVAKHFYIIKVLWSTVISDEIVATAFSRGGRNRHVCVIATASKEIEPKGIIK